MSNPWMNPRLCVGFGFAGLLAVLAGCVPFASRDESLDAGAPAVDGQTMRDGMASSDGALSGDAVGPDGPRSDGGMGCEDSDGDGFASAVCGGTDCDDADPTRHPGAAEICDDNDEDCDEATLGPDADGDGVVYFGCCADDGRCGSDCDDGRPTINPLGIESCNGFDDDCDGVVDEDVAAVACFDEDGDGRGPVGTTVAGCSLPIGATMTCNDCDDADASRYVGATEVCNGVDDDCDDVVDEGCTCTTGTDRPCGTNVGVCREGTQRCLGSPSFWEAACVGGVSPGVERCNGEDDDCDGMVDEGVETQFFADCDADGFGNPTLVVDGCTRPLAAPSACLRGVWTTEGGDCDDTDPTRNIRFGCEPVMDAGVPDAGVGTGDAGMDFGFVDFGAGDAGASDMHVTVPNIAPTLVAVMINPAIAYVTSTLACEFEATDPDTAMLDVTYAWQVNGTIVSGELSSTLPGSAFRRGDIVTCTVVVSDGTSTAGPVTSAGVTIGNRTPRAEFGSSTPDPVTRSSLLTVNVATSDDDPGDAVTLRYAWTRNGAVVAGQTSETYGGTQVKNDLIVVRVTPNDGIDDGLTITRAWMVANSPPAIPGVMLTSNATIADQPDTTSVLTCTVVSPSTDPDGDVVSYVARWERNGVEYTGAGVTTVARAPAVLNNTVGALATSDGDEWVCLVSAFDGDSGSRAPGEDRIGIHFLAGLLDVAGARTDIDTDEVVFFPVTASMSCFVRAIRISFSVADSGRDFETAVYDSNGPMGGPGTLLGTVNRGLTLSSGIVEVEFPPEALPVSGSLWVAVRAGGNNVSVARSSGLPGPTTIYRDTGVAVLPADTGILTVSAATSTEHGVAIWCSP
jgi:hypothetical protein